MTPSTERLDGCTMRKYQVADVAIITQVDDGKAERIAHIEAWGCLDTLLADGATLRAMRALLNSAPVVALLDA